VTDLGTEFGVEVDKLGATRSHVFRGKVKVQLVEKGKPDGESILLSENEGADVAAGLTRPVKVIHGAGKSAAVAFVRQMPRWTPIKVFNTGLGLKVSNTDPHWQVVAASNDPKFKPRPAIVTSIIQGRYLDNDPARSQWVSSFARAPTSDTQYMPLLPSNVTYTFRTTFELQEVSPESAVLQGRFITGNQVTAIRLNGHAVPVPKQGKAARFDRFYPFTVDEGFVEGTNVLEIDVFNGQSEMMARLGDSAESPLAIRVELMGHGLRRGQGEATTPPMSPRGGGRKEAGQ
jgi:hypothetical protein